MRVERSQEMLEEMMMMVKSKVRTLLPGATFLPFCSNGPPHSNIRSIRTLVNYGFTDLLSGKYCSNFDSQLSGCWIPLGII